MGRFQRAVNMICVCMNCNQSRTGTSRMWWTGMKLDPCDTPTSILKRFLLQGWLTNTFSHFTKDEAYTRVSSASWLPLGTPNLPTNIVGFRGFDSSIILNLRGGIPRPIGDFPESLRQAMAVGVMLVGRLGVADPGNSGCTRSFRMFRPMPLHLSIQHTFWNEIGNIFAKERSRPALNGLQQLFQHVNAQTSDNQPHSGTPRPARERTSGLYPRWMLRALDTIRLTNIKGFITITITVTIIITCLYY